MIYEYKSFSYLRNHLLWTYAKLFTISLADDNYADKIAIGVMPITRSYGLHVNAQKVVNNDQL